MNIRDIKKNPVPADCICDIIRSKEKQSSWHRSLETATIPKTIMHRPSHEVVSKVHNQNKKIFKFSLFLICCVLFQNLSAQALVEIWQIQGTQNTSPYDNNFVRTENNIVTSVTDDFFIIQTPDERSDQNRTTSDAIIVIEDDFDFEVGDLVSVEGYVTESNSGTTLILAEDVASILISSNNPLPSFVTVDVSYPVSTNASVSAWEGVESMLINLDNFVFTGAADEDGFANVSPVQNRPFREAGSEFNSYNGSPIWDGNPEVLLFISDGLDLSPNEALGAGMQLNGLGIIIGEPRNYALLPITYSVEGDYKYQAVRAREAQEALIGNINALFFMPSNNNYELRVEKLAHYVLNTMQAPDIIAFQEVGSQKALEDVAAKILEMDSEQNYSAHLRQGSGSIHTGFMVKNTVSNIVVEQLGEDESLSIGGRKHDRPPLLLKAELNTNPPTPIAVLNLHIRSLNGIEGSDQTFVRTKRHEQGISIAKMVKALQLQYDNIFVLGDFNAFQFTDGYVDVVNQISGQTSLGAQYEIESVLDEPLINHSLSVPEEEQYSYVFRGNAQILDHCLSTANLSQIEVDELQYTRGNADNPPSLENDDPILRISDHDGFVLFLDTESNLFTSTSSNPIPANAGISHPNPFVAGDLILFNLDQKENLEYQLFSVNGILVGSGTLDGIQSDSFELPIPNNVVDGIYILQIKGNQTDYTTKLFIDN